MIRRIELVYPPEPVWGRGYTYPAVPIVPYVEGDVLWSREYPKGTPISTIWRDTRGRMIEIFFEIFHSAVIVQTHPPTPPTDIPDLALSRQSKHVREKQRTLPEFYEWNPEFKKWHMTAEGYLSQVREFGGRMRMGVATSPYEEMYDYSLLEEMQERFKGMTKTVIVMCYPDKYDDEIRILMKLRITFW